jgi:hypothetical protein
MARTRSLNPQQTVDEDVNKLSIHARYVWAFLPCHADREGRLADKPFSLKLAILPVDEVDMDALLREIAAQGFIRRYTVGGRGYIQIRSFLRHQHPHRRECDSIIPPEGSANDGPRTGLGQDEPGNSPASTVLGQASDNPPESLGPRNSAARPVLGQAQPGGSGSGSGSGDLSHSRALARDPGPEPLAPGPVPPPAVIPPPPLEAPPVRRLAGYDLQCWFGQIRAEFLGGLPWTVPPSADGKADTFAARLTPDDVVAVKPTMRRLFEHVTSGDEDWEDERLKTPAFAFGAWMARFTELREEMVSAAQKRAAHARRKVFDPKAQPI